jgi:hypothetical protein
MWGIYADKLFEIQPEDMKRAVENDNCKAFWCKVGNSYPLFVMGESLFETELEAVSLIMSSLLEKHEELRVKYCSLKQRYQELIKNETA